MAKTCVPTTRPWQSETVFTGGDEYFQQLELDIFRARHTIDLAFYIFSFDALGNKILSALQAASGRGVRVRIIVDGIGSPQWHAGTLRQLAQSGIEARIYHPYPWRFSLRALRRINVLLERFFHLWRKINTRDHRKSCVIDDEIAWVGSFNLVQYHMQCYMNNLAWRDTGVRVCGPQVKMITAIFDYIWCRRRYPVTEPLSSLPHLGYGSVVRSNVSIRLRRLFARELYHNIIFATQRVWATNAYFVPVSRLQLSLIRAAKKGIDVRLILPAMSDVIFAPWIARFYYRILLLSGVRIFEYQPSILHAKTLLFDDFAYVGSSNLNHRSLLHDLELDIVCRQQESIKTLEQQFLIDQCLSVEITQDKLNRGRWWEKILARALLILKSWM
ncbi:phospholipase D-like domain-containing protein [Thalassomonas actiniarum]|uniref:Phosphatidylserine/phosphatidylglycerophosphate/ cardiolipin synthase family protein n=1 Tax=Thalassomonas actiniarum TaxID=485447 RepID=A0AAE9YP08_9GAMM|nr:phosphatidylserine/phosphatidylglycerophosphate/cardiolipin synthase family protein [Thalassomonas actiniarum]WDD97604.1 phosphatidylserine/phosphatidylglycerophosphate/cardiolipin synthase family protein [Thalassomonas actiniarum]